ncbi:membrane protein [Nostoc piscinale CENA21]|uniref:Membrane protein n=1 Tax=Nostoc piscinale CENA21 TaxID=224013 RepID=A0A0M5MG82_9NOSO|nr:YkvA family protein [Nostoc piscinale]ALF51718.1 membrane protein [Nostoc piscinale CENA21]
MHSLKQLAKQLKKDIYAIYLATQNPKVPWYARLLAVVVVAYAFSPIDLIPDAIPIFGYLDDLILVPLGIWLILKLIPSSVLAECREKAESTQFQNKPVNWIAAGIIVLIWLVVGVLFVLCLRYWWKIKR